MVRRSTVTMRRRAEHGSRTTTTLGPVKAVTDPRNGKLQDTLATSHHGVRFTPQHPDFHQTMEVPGICLHMTEVPPPAHTLTVASGHFAPKMQVPVPGKEEPDMSERPKLFTVASADTVSTAILAPDHLKFKGLYPPFEQRRESADQVGQVLDMYYRPNSSSLVPSAWQGNAHRGNSGVSYSPLNNTK